MLISLELLVILCPFHLLTTQIKKMQNKNERLAIANKT